MNNVELICINNTYLSIGLTIGKKYVGDVINNYSACGKIIVSKSYIITNDNNVKCRYGARIFKTKSEIRQDYIKELLYYEK